MQSYTLEFVSKLSTDDGHSIGLNKVNETGEWVYDCDDFVLTCPMRARTAIDLAKLLENGCSLSEFNKAILKYKVSRR